MATLPMSLQENPGITEQVERSEHDVATVCNAPSGPRLP